MVVSDLMIILTRRSIQPRVVLIHGPDKTMVLLHHITSRPRDHGRQPDLTRGGIGEMRLLKDGSTCGPMLT